MGRFLLTVVSGMTAVSVFAADYTWLGGSGSFQSPSNWSPSTGIPGAADKALFTAAGGYSVSWADAATNAGATVGADVTLALNGYPWVLSGALAFSGSGVARVGGGALEVGSTVTVGSGQKLVLDSGTSWFKGAQLGTASGGTIEVNGGDHVLAWAMPLNPPPAGGASFRMTGGRFSMTNNDNNARCSMWNGSRMSLEGGTLSIRYQVDINGVPAAPAVIDIYTNAALLQNPGIGFNVSRTAGGLGIVNIRGGSLILSNSNCNVVNMNSTTLSTTGIVNLVDGAIVAGNLTMGYTSNGVAIVRQTGGRMLVTGDTYIGKERDTLGLLTQEGGDAWCNQLYVGGFAGGGCKGEVNLSGGTFAVVGSSSAVGKYAGSTGRLLQTGGALIISNSFAVGNAAGAFGVITNTGGSFWMSGTLNLGSSGAGAFGRAYFSGPSNYVKNAISVGTNASDTGELVVAGGLLVSDGNVTVANMAGATGSVSVTGGTALFKALTVGQSGRGALAVSGGLLAVTNGGAVMAGSSVGSVGTVEISGGTNLFMGQGLTFGQNGSSVLRMTGGYLYTTNRVVFGGAVSGTGRLELVGGILSTPIIDGRDPTLATNPGGYSEVLFDGGTLQHSVDGEAWMPTMFVGTFAKATLTARGAVIDSNGGVLAIPQALSNEVGHAGSFTKKGAGSVTLTSGQNAFTGRVAVEQGELAVSANGGISLAGGVAVGAGAVLNLSSAGVLRALATDSGTDSRIDGVLVLKSGCTLTNGVGASLGGSGVVTGSVVFASGSFYGRDRSAAAGALQVTGGAAFQVGVAVRLTGYTVQELAAGIPLVTAAGGIQMADLIPVTLDGSSHPYWWAQRSSDGRTLTARVIPRGTLLSVW